MGSAYETLVEKYGVEGARKLMSERASKRKDFSQSYFTRLKAEGKEDELKKLQARGAKKRARRDTV